MARSSYKALLASLASALALGACLTPALAKDADFIVDTDSIGRSDNGVISSDQMLELGVPTSNGLRLEGEQSLRYGSLDRAIMVLQRSVEMSPMDMDGRIMYAEALEKKLMKQKERDPVLFNFLIKQWLFVAKKAEFYDQKAQAAGHLRNLTGRMPSKFETSTRYLSKVLMPEDGSKKVALGKKIGASATK